MPARLPALAGMHACRAGHTRPTPHGAQRWIAERQRRHPPCTCAQQGAATGSKHGGGGGGVKGLTGAVVEPALVQTRRPAVGARRSLQRGVTTFQGPRRALEPRICGPRLQPAVTTEMAARGWLTRHPCSPAAGAGCIGSGFGEEAFHTVKLITMRLLSYMSQRGSRWRG